MVDYFINEVSPKEKAVVTFTVDGKTVATNNVVMPRGEWAAYWQPHYEWKENWVGDVDKGEWVELL